MAGAHQTPVKWHWRAGPRGDTVQPALASKPPGPPLVIPGTYALHLLGGFELGAPGPDVALSAGKPLAAIAYLACARGRRVSRQMLLELLWADVEPERGRASLRQTLFALRQRFGPTFIVGDGEWLTLTADCPADVQEFTLAVEAADLTRALELYTGDFIPQFAAPGAADFERWADTERLRLRGAFLAVGHSELRRLIADGDATAAVALGGRLRDTDSDDDEHWRARFEALALAGRFAHVELEEAALRAKRSEDGRTVEPATEALLRRLKNAAGVAIAAAPADTSPSARIPPDPEFQGRADVFAQLLSAWRLACRGRAQHRTLIAAAGLGKTRLLRELARRLASQRARVVYVGARQGERDDAYAFLAEVVSRVAVLPGAAGIAPSSASVLAGLVPALGDTFNVKPESGVNDGTELLRRRVLALADLLGAVADETSIVLLADDLQWADAQSVQALDRAFARVPNGQLLLVGATRTDSPPLAASGERLALPPLSHDEVAALIGSIASTEPPGWSDTITAAIHAATGGAPFAILQFLHLAVERALLRIGENRWDVPDESAVQRLLDQSATVEWRLQSLNEIDLETLVLLVLCRDGLAEPTLASVRAVDPDALRASLFRLESNSLVVRTSGEQWRVVHDLVAEGALAVANAGLKQRCAASIGYVLAASAVKSDLVSARRVVRLLLDGGTPDAALRFARQWLDRQPRDAWTPAQFAATLLGAREDPAVASQLRALVRRRLRWWRSRLLIAAGSIAATFFLVAIALFRPASLVSTSELDPTELSDWRYTYEVPPRVELRNALGVATRWRDGDTVRVLSSRSTEPLRGRPFAVLRNGVAIFDSLYPAPPPSVGGPPSTDLRFTVNGLPPLVLRHHVLGDSLVVIDALLNGRQVRDSAPTFRVSPGQRIEGTVRLRYATYERGSLYVLGQATTWGRAERDTLTVRSLYSGVAGATFPVAISLTAPSKPGDYWILWTHGAETSAVWLLSGTNWACHDPVWGDGNDLSKLPDSTLTRGVQRHELSVPFLYCSGPETDRSGSPARGERTYSPRRLALAGVRVQVREGK